MGSVKTPCQNSTQNPVCDANSCLGQRPVTGRVKFFRSWFFLLLFLLSVQTNIVNLNSDPMGVRALSASLHHSLLKFSNLKLAKYGNL